MKPEYNYSESPTLQLSNSKTQTESNVEFEFVNDGKNKYYRIIEVPERIKIIRQAIKELWPIDQD